MSAPATNARPAPVRITPPTSCDAQARSIAAPRAAIVALSSAFSLSGRDTVIVAMRSATSYVTGEDWASEALIGGEGLLEGRSGAVRERRNVTPRTAFCPARARHGNVDTRTLDPEEGKPRARLSLRVGERDADSRREDAGAHPVARGPAGVDRRAPVSDRTQLDPGMGLRRARAEAVPLPRERDAARRAAEVLSRAPARPRPAAHPSRARRSREEARAVARARRRRRAPPDRRALLPSGQRSLCEGEPLVRHHHAAKVARDRRRPAVDVRLPRQERRQAATDRRRSRHRALRAHAPR